MEIESEKIKEVMKMVCKANGDKKSFDIMSKLLDYIHLHENMPENTLIENVIEEIDRLEGQDH